MNDLLTSEMAQRCAARVDSGKVGFSPTVILSIFAAVLPLMSVCINKDVPTPEQAHAKVREWNASDPERLLKRTARRVRAEAEERMSKDEARELARAIIAECCASDEEDVTAFCAAHR